MRRQAGKRGERGKLVERLANRGAGDADLFEEALAGSLLPACAARIPRICPACSLSTQAVRASDRWSRITPAGISTAPSNWSRSPAQARLFAVAAPSHSCTETSVVPVPMPR